MMPDNAAKSSSGNSSDERPKLVNYVHPSQVMSLDFPEHWNVEVTQEVTVGLELQSPEEHEVRLGFFALPYQIPIALLPPEKLQQLLHDFLESAGATASNVSPLLYYPARYAQTENSSHCWMVAHEDVIMSAQAFYPESLEHVYRPLMERILSSFRIYRDGAGAKLLLLHEVLAQLKQACPELSFELEDGAIKGEQLTIGVDNLAAMIARQPELREPMIAEFVATVATTYRSRETLSKGGWEDVQSQVFPMVRQDALPAVIDEQTTGTSESDSARQQQLVYSPWLANLIVCYAIDSEKSLRMINVGDLERWDIDMAQLHARAMENLTSREFPSMMGAAVGDGELSVGLLAEGGISTKSSYVLHPHLQEKIKAHFSGEVWIALPSRDSLVVLSKALGGRQELLQMVAADFNSTDNPLSDRLFEPTADGVVLA